MEDWEDFLFALLNFGEWTLSTGLRHIAASSNFLLQPLDVSLQVSAEFFNGNAVNAAHRPVWGDALVVGQDKNFSSGKRSKRKCAMSIRREQSDDCNVSTFVLWYFYSKKSLSLPHRTGRVRKKMQTYSPSFMLMRKLYLFCSAEI